MPSEAAIATDEQNRGGTGGIGSSVVDVGTVNVRVQLEGLAAFLQKRPAAFTGE